MAPERTPLVVLLLTPSLMYLLSEDDAFISRSLTHIFKERPSTTAHAYDAIIAVVDKLPTIETRAHELRPHGQRQESNNFPDSGREGLAILVGSSEPHAPDLWEPRSENRPVDNMSIQQKSTISFLLDPLVEFNASDLSSVRKDRLFHYKFGPQQNVLSTRTFEVPLANTIFQNGQTSTMYISSWTHESASNVLVRTTKVSIQNQLVKVPRRIDTTRRGRMAFTIPLKSLTVPRQVAAAVGNIIRRVHLTDRTSEAVPASEELERQIAALPAAAFLGVEKQRLTVWALVTPRGRWTSEPTLPVKTLHDMLEQGSRLHRVLSGGGGWGQKQGLLSLDPESTYCTDLTPDTQSYGTGESFGQEQKDAWGEVVKPGDLVQFFIPPQKVLSAAREAKPLGDAAINAAKIPPVTTVEFGTIPSTIDNMAEAPLPEADVPKSADIEVAVNCFGALSEQGVSMSIKMFSNVSDGSDEWVGAHRMGQVVQSKVDVPYSKFNYTNFSWDTVTQALEQYQKDGSKSLNSESTAVPDGDGRRTVHEHDKVKIGTHRQESFKRLELGNEDVTRLFPASRKVSISRHQTQSRGSEQARSGTSKGDESREGQEQKGGSAVINNDEERIELSKEERLRKLNELFLQG